MANLDPQHAQPIDAIGHGPSASVSHHRIARCPQVPLRKEIEDTLPLPDCFPCGRPRVSCWLIGEALAVWKTPTDYCSLLYVRQRLSDFRGSANIREFSTRRALAFSWYRAPRRNRRQDRPTGPVESVGRR